MARRQRCAVGLVINERNEHQFLATEKEVHYIVIGKFTKDKGLEKYKNENAMNGGNIDESGIEAFDSLNDCFGTL